MRTVLACALSACLCSVALAATPASFAYVLQADADTPKKEDAVKKLAALDRDWLVLDVAFNSEEAWQKADIDAIRGGKKKVVAYISVGEAEDYRPYWKKEWKRTKPAWLGRENPDWKGNFQVEYWNPEWQAIILGSIDAAMTAGFDGVYLDMVDGFETYEKEGNRFIDDRPNPKTKQSYRRDMVDWVKKIAARARASHPGALVIPQNGSQLLDHPDFVAAISGIGIEDLFTEDNRMQPADHSEYVVGFLKKLSGTDKPVLVIEYPTRKDPIEKAKAANHQAGFTWLITDRELKQPGVSGR